MMRSAPGMIVILLTLLFVSGDALGQCEGCKGDFDGDGKVDIAELVTAVGNALNGCHPSCPCDLSGDWSFHIEELSRDCGPLDDPQTGVLVITHQGCTKISITEAPPGAPDTIQATFEDGVISFERCEALETPGYPRLLREGLLTVAENCNSFAGEVTGVEATEQCHDTPGCMFVDRITATRL